MQLGATLSFLHWAVDRVIFSVIYAHLGIDYIIGAYSVPGGQPAISSSKVGGSDGSMRNAVTVSELLIWWAIVHEMP